MIKYAEMTQYLRHKLGFDQMNKHNPVLRHRLGFDPMNKHNPVLRHRLRFDQMNGMNVYNFLYMVSSIGGTNSNTACLGEDVDDLMEMDRKSILILLGKK